MDLKEAVAIARQQVTDLLAPDTPHNLRLEEFLYDDHMMIWTLTIGFALPTENEASARRYKIIRVSEANKSVLSIRDR